MRALSLLLLAGCWGRNIPYEGGPGGGGDDSVPIVTTCGEDVDRSAGFTVEGTTVSVADGALAAEGLCVQAVDPAPALTGGEPTVIASSQVCADGTYVVGPIDSAPSVGMFIMLDDCEGAKDTLMKSATGIAPEQYEGLGAGDTLMIDALFATLEWVALEQADLEQVAWSGDLASSGYMAGIVEDASMAALSGATVGCSGCATVYYEDALADDGIYGASATANTMTAADGGGMFMIPGAPIFTYTCEDGGAHTWDSKLLGSLPGYAVYTRFTAQ